MRGSLVSFFVALTLGVFHYAYYPDGWVGPMVFMSICVYEGTMTLIELWIPDEWKREWKGDK